MYPQRWLSVTLGGHACYRNWQAEQQEEYDAVAAELESEVPFGSLYRAAPGAPRVSESDVRAQSAALALENDVKALAAFNRGGRRDLFVSDKEVVAIRVPMLAVMGSLDDVAAVNRLRAILPALRVVIVDGATHAGSRGAARRPEFLAAVREFIGARR